MEDHKPDPDMEEEKDVLKANAAEVFDYQNEKALMRKIDWQYEICSLLCNIRAESNWHAFFSILPVMFVAYMLQFLDKTALGYTAIFGIQKSLVCISDRAKG